MLYVLGRRRAWILAISLSVSIRECRCKPRSINVDDKTPSRDALIISPCDDEAGVSVVKM